MALKDKEQYDANNSKSIYRSICEAVRMSTLYFVNTQLQRGRQINRATSLWLYPWDEGQKAQTADEMRNMMRLIASSYIGKKKQPSVRERRKAHTERMKQKIRNQKAKNK